MEFKRTSEGRIFFSDNKTQDSHETHNGNDTPILTSPLTGRILQEDAAEPARSAPESYDKIARDAPQAEKKSQQDLQSQYQVITLLKNLNEKLKLTQVERNTMRQELKAYRKMIADLETKSIAQQNAFQNLQTKMQTGNKNHTSQEHGQEIEKTLAENRRLFERLENRTERTDRSLSELMSKAESYTDLTESLSQKEEEIQKLHKQLEEDRQAYKKNFEDIKKRVSQTEDVQSVMKVQLTSSLENNQKIHTLIEEDRADRIKFMRKLERLETSLHDINKNQPLLGDDTPLIASAHADKELEATQGDGMHVPHHLVHKTAERDEQPEKQNKFDQLVNHVLNKDINLSAPVLIAGSAILLMAGWFMNQNETININAPDAPVAANQSTPLSVQKQAKQYNPPSLTNTQKPNWETTENAAPFSVASSAPANIKNPNIPTNDQIETLDKIMETDPDQAAAILNQMQPGTPAQDAPALSIPTEIPTQSAQEQSNTDSNPTTKDSALPKEYQQLEQMAFNGDANAQHDLAALYVMGENNMPQNYTRAAYWFDKAAQGGIANATYNMGVLYQQGLGVQKDVSQAVRWYVTAADQGHGEAAYNLGIAYIEGIGVEYNPYKAALHFEQAATNGIKEAAYNLGLIYENGLLGSPQPREALMWYKQAADQGLSEAQNALGQLIKSLGISYSEIEKIVNETQQKYPQISKNNAVENSVQSNINKTEDNLIGKVQQSLMNLSLYPGPVDGKIGPLTQDAVRAYQKSYDLPITGEITPALYQHMQQ